MTERVGLTQSWGRSKAAVAGCALAAWLAVGIGAALADWRDEVEVLRVGYLSPGDVAPASARMERFRGYLEGRIGIPVELVPAATYPVLIDAIVDGRTQYAIHSATSFVVAEEACGCIEPLAIPAAYDGSVGFYSILLARTDGPIHSVSDARGARLALAGEDSVAGRLMPLAGLSAEGIDPTSHFSEIIDVPGPEAAVAALLSGEVDVAVGWSSLAGDPATGYSFGLLTRLVIDGRLSMDAVRIVWRSELIPFGPHAVRTDLPSELKLLLADALFDMAALAPDVLEAVDRSGFGGGGFVAIDPGAFGAVAALIAPRD